MPRPVRPALLALTAVLVLLGSGCARMAPAEDPGPGAATPAATPLTEAGAGEIAQRRDLPEHYEQPDLPGDTRAEQQPATVTVSAATTGENYSHGGVGLSFEATELADERLAPGNSDLVALVRALDRPTLRFGGNSVDRRFFFMDDDDAPPTDWPLQEGEEITTVTPEDLHRVADFAEAAGAKVILGANLAADDAERAGDLARHAREAFGEDLLAIMVGNEPNGYFLGEGHRLTVKDASWGIPAYLADLREYAAAIRAEVPDLPLTAPGAYAPDWWEAVAGAGIDNVVLAAHQYPLSSCDASVPHQAPTMANLVAAHTRDNVDRFLGIAVDRADAASMPVWLTETSVSACLGGNEITESLGSAVFSAEYSVRAQSLGVERLVHHSSLEPCAGGPPMSTVCSSGTVRDPGEAFAPRANHLGLALVGQIPDGEFLATDVAGNEDVTAYAIAHPADRRGRERVSLVVTNFADPATAGRTPVTVGLPFPVQDAVLTQLGGPDRDAQYPSASLFDGAAWQAGEDAAGQHTQGAGGQQTESTDGQQTRGADAQQSEDGDRQPAEDADGPALTVGSALEPVGADHVSVDGWGLPLTPVAHRAAVAGVVPGDPEVTVSLNPGTATVLTLTRA